MIHMKPWGNFNYPKAGDPSIRSTNLSYIEHIYHSLLFWYIFSENKICCSENQKVIPGCQMYKRNESLKIGQIMNKVNFFIIFFLGNTVVSTTVKQGQQASW